MSATLLDGTAIAKTIREEMKEQIKAEGLAPGLGIVLVGDDPASRLYVSLKEKAAAEIGIRVFRTDLPADTSERTVIEKVRAYNDTREVHGILVQMPLPDTVNPNAVVAALAPEKDADGFHPQNRTGVLPPVVAGSLVLLHKTGDIAGRRAVVVSRNPVFGQTFCDALRERDVRAEPTYPENASLMREADILIVAIGSPGFLTPEMVKPGAVVIDVGVSTVGGRTVGDAAPGVAEVASFLTPVPGGVGPMTVAMLLRNVVELCRRERKAAA